jgi:gas vesicle protein
MDLPFESSDDRELIRSEAEADPVFAKRLWVTLSMPDGEKRVALSARKAVANEFDPKLYPETRETWKKLRATVRDLVEFAANSVRGIDFGPEIRKAAVSRLHGLGELGQWDIIGSIVGAVAGAASNIYTANLQASTTRQIQSEQLAAQMAQIQAQESMARAQAAMANAQIAQTGAPGQVASATSGIASNVMDTLSQPIVGGIPLWAVLLGVFFFAEKA